MAQLTILLQLGYSSVNYHTSFLASGTVSWSNAVNYGGIKVVYDSDYLTSVESVGRHASLDGNEVITSSLVCYLLKVLGDNQHFP